MGPIARQGAASCATSQTVTLRSIVHRFCGLAHCLASPGRTILWKERRARACAKYHGLPHRPNFVTLCNNRPIQRYRHMGNNDSSIWATTTAAYGQQRQQHMGNNGIVI
jgi:hypothetical protein